MSAGSPLATLLCIRQMDVSLRQHPSGQNGQQSGAYLRWKALLPDQTT